MLAKGPFVGTSDSDPETANTSVASYSPLRMLPNDPTDVISYDAPMSAFCRQLSQAPIFNNVVIRPANNLNGQTDVDSFFSQDNKENSAEESERRAQLNQRKALLELALAETLHEMKGF